MADEKPSLHIDTDWKKQAQEEKRKLAEEEQKKKQEAATAGPAGFVAGPSRTATSTPSGAGPGRTAPSGARQRELPEASFATLVQSIMTQVLFYLGDMTARGMEPSVNLDMAKHHIDTLSVLEEKTKGNLTDDEKHMLDAALYECRMRYVSVASQYIS
jgi:hypothetical protein